MTVVISENNCTDVQRTPNKLVNAGVTEELGKQIHKNGKLLFMSVIYLVHVFRDSPI